jgi:predicted O-linked N-acetylglucosamine transferase (SPINDLY family)
MNRKQRRAAAKSGKSGTTQVGGSPLTDGKLKAAVSYHQAGRLAEAKNLYGEILSQEPKNVAALQFLGVITCQEGAPRRAAELIGMALALRPDYAEAHNNLGTAMRTLGNLEDAATSYRRALQLQPSYFEAHNNLGNALRDLGRPEEAVVACQGALALKPNYAEAHNNLGNALQDLGKLEEAVAAYRKALDFKPNYAEAHNNLGNALRDLGRPEEAVTACRNAVALRPNFPEAHYNLANALNDQNKFAEAVAALHKVLELKPDFAEAHYNLGNAFLEQGKLEEATAALKRALVLKSDYAEAHANLGSALRRSNRLEEAVVAHHRALDLKPDYAEAFYNLGNALANQGKLEAATTALQRALMLKPDYAKAHDNLLLNMNYDGRFSQQDIFAESRRWDEAHAALRNGRERIYANDRGPDRKLRIGYLSPDFRTHSVSYFVEPLIAAHDRHSFEVFCYAEVKIPDDKTARYKALADAWRSTVGATDSAVADWIQEDRIDILVDLAGHTAKNRLAVFTMAPAPVQVTWLGYPNTTGLSVMDYRLTDEIADPKGAADTLYSETLVRLPNGFLCLSPMDEAPEVTEAPGLTEGHVTFGSFNNLSKVTPEVVETWARILDRVPGSRLLIKNRSLADEATRNRYLEMFLSHGVDSARVELFAWIESSSGHLGLYNRVDIALDTFPYNGTLTTFEALWMGVPVVTLCGDRHSGRVGASILTRVGLVDLIAETKDAYIETAVRLADAEDQLSELRRSLRDRVQTSPLCDSRGFAQDVETEYRKMWHLWCGQGPAA